MTYEAQDPDGDGYAGAAAHADHSAVVWRDSLTSGTMRGYSYLTDTEYTSDTDVSDVVEPIFEEFALNSYEIENNNRNGARLFWRRGEYPADSPLTVASPNTTEQLKGAEIVGEAVGGQNTRNMGTRIVPGPNLGATADILRISDGLDSSEGAGTQLRFICVDAEGADTTGIHLQATDRLEFEGVVSVNHGDGGRAVLAEGLYNSIFRFCNFYSVELNDGNDAGENVNNNTFTRCLFRTPDAGSPAFAPLILEDGGNWLDHCIVNSLNVAAGTPAIGGNIQRWRFTQCNIYGDGQPLIDGPVRCQFVGGNLGGEVLNPQRCKFIGVRNWDLGTNASLHFDGSAGKEDNLIQGCTFDRGSTTTPAILAANTNGNEYLNQTTIANNTIRNAGGTADIQLDRNVVGTDVTIRDNHLVDGITQEFGSALIANGTEARFVQNSGYNPIGGTRSTPSLPGSTGTAVSNSYGEPALVYQAGAGGTTVTDQRGNSTALAADPGVVRVPPLGQIEYSSSVPSAWTWWWE